MVITKDIKRAITFIRIMLQGHGYSFYSYYFFNKGEYFIIMSLDLQQYHDQIQALRPMDDVFFEVLIQQPGVCEEMLRVLLDCPDLIVLDIHAQHSIRNLLKRSVRLDALCHLPNNKLVNIEIQNENNTNHFKRVRYNEACVTTQATDPGTDFENIPAVYSLYISDFDMFKKGKTIYHIRKSVIETDQTVDVGTLEIYANTIVNDKSTIAEYLQLLKKTAIDNPKFPHLTEGVKYLKNERRGVEKMSGFLAELLEKEVQKEVKKELQKEVQKELQKELQKKCNEIAISKICKMIELGYSKEDILKLDYTNAEYDLALEKVSPKSVL